MKKLFFTIILICYYCIANAQNINVSGALVGNGTYPDLASAFTAINGGAQTGANILVTVVGNTAETTTAGLNANTWATLTISPSGGTTRTISGNIAGYIVDLVGADNVTLNGLNSGGNALIIENTNVGSSGTINFRDDASANVITNLTLRSAGNVNTVGNINFAAGNVVGNDNNTISFCTLEGSGANFPATQIFSNGSATAGIENSGNTITNCNVSNFFSATIQSFGINITNTGNLSWTISNNRIYQTATRTYTTANTHNGITLSGGSSTISNNIIGFATNTGTGVYTMAGTIATRFIAINVFVNNASLTSVTGNTISAFSLNTSSGATTTNGIFCGINITAGKVNVANNIIGATTGTGSIITTSTTTGGLLVGINCQANNAGDSVFVNSNQIGACTNSGITATIAGSITGINVSATGQHVRILNNTIGNTTADNLRGGTLGLTTGSSIVVGINLPSMPVNPIVTGNTIRNLASYGTGTTGSVRGIGTAAATANVNSFIIENNTIENFVTNNANTTIANAASGCQGIQIGIGTNNIVRGNLIRNLSNISTSANQSYVIGIGSGNATNTTIEKNVIHSLSNAGTSVTATTPSVIAGIVVRSGTTAVNISNNMISLGNGITNNNAIVGIQLNNGSTPDPLSNIYHNTINILGTVTAGAQPSFGICRTDFGVTTRTAAVDIRNNIITNSRTGGTGVHCAIGNNFNATVSSTGWGLNASNFNVLNSNASTIGHWGAALNYATWQTTSNSDANSFSGITVNYVNPVNDLHLNMGLTPTVLESNGATIASVTTDIDNQNRPGPTGSVNGGAFAPDLGADEFDGVFIDITPPQIVYTALPFICSTSDRVLAANITDLSGIPTSGALQPRIYFRKNAGAWFSTQGVLSSGTANNGNWNFTISSALMGGVVVGDVISYYVIAQDIVSPTPNITSNPVAGLVATNVNTVTTPPTTPNSYPISTTLSGTYTVGVTGTYPTLTAAANAYNTNCLSGNIIFSLIDATYPTETYPIVFQSNPDASAINTLTIKPATGVNTSISGSSTTAILQINGGDYITIDGTNGTTVNSICPTVRASRNLTVENTNISVASAVVSFNTTATGNAATNNKVINTTIIGNAPLTTGVGINISGPTIGSGVGANGNNFNEIINDSIIRCQVGVFSAGASLVTKNRQNKYNLNTMNASGTNGIGRIGILALFEDSVFIQNNIIGNIVNTASTDVIAISAGSNTLSNTLITGAEVTNATITGNTITEIVQTGTFSAGGIIVAETPTGTTRIYNNIINRVFCNGTAGDFATGIYWGGGAGNMEVYHNTVHVTGTTLTGASQPNMAIGINGTTPNINMRNNIFMCSGSNGFNGNTGIGLAYTSVTGNYTNLISESNNIVVSGTGSGIGRTGGLGAGTVRTTMLDWQTETGRDFLSFITPPVFVSSTDLHIVANSNFSLENRGLSLGITTDIDCNTRNTTPDIGADEVCSNPLIASITVSNNPTCSGDSVLIVVNGTLRDATTWNWATDSCSATVFSNNDSIWVTPTSTESYFVYGNGGCITTATCANTTITVNPLPSTAFTITPNDSICFGDSLMLDYLGTFSAIWSSISDSTFFTPTSSGSYFLQVTDINGCVNRDTADITVNPLPLVSYTASPNDTICAGTSLTLNGTGAITYTWTGGITNGSLFTPTSSTSYIVTGTDANGCANSDTANVVVNTNPTVNLGADIVQPNPPAILDAGGGFIGYDWNTGATTQTINATVNGTYSVTVVNAAGCTDSDTINVTFTFGISNLDGTNSTIQIYPNPSNGIVNLAISNLETNKLELDVIDISGKVVFIMSPIAVQTTTTQTIDVTHLSAGAYTMRVRANGDNLQLPFIKY